MNRRQFISGSTASVAVAAMAKNALAKTEGLNDDTSFEGRVVDERGNPMPGIIVSDGLNCVRTDAKGVYNLPLRKEARFVTVTTPSGYECEWSYYEPFFDKFPKVFYLTPSKYGAGKGCSFVHIADSEISGHTDYNRCWTRRVMDIAAKEECSFIIHTGDICKRRGMIAHNQILNRAIAGIPVRYVLGNHDMIRGVYGEAFFESQFGPAWYSFETGGVHFVVTPMWGGDWKTGFSYHDIVAWIKNDLELVDPKMPVVFFNHMLPSAGRDETFGRIYGDNKDFVDLYKICNYKGFVYGHTHSSSFIRRDGASFINTAQPHTAGIGNAPSQVRVVKIDGDGNITAKSYYGRELEWKTDSAGAKWETKLSSHVLFGAPLLAEKKLFVATEDDDGLGTGTVVALNSKTGRVLWQTKTKNTIKRDLAYADGVIVGMDCEANVYGFNIANGKIIWEHSFGLAEEIITGGSVATPDGKCVLVGVGKRMAVVIAKSGKIVWKGAGWQDGTECSVSPGIGDGKIVSLVNWRGVKCNDLKTGKLLWESNFAGHAFVGPDPIIMDGKVYAFAANYLSIFDLATGKLLKGVNLHNGVQTPCGQPLYDDRYFYIGTNGSGRLMAVNRQTFKADWYSDSVDVTLAATTAYGSDEMRTFNTAPRRLPDGRFVAALSDGTIRVIDPKNGKFLKTLKTGAPYLASVTVDGSGTVYTADLAGYVRAFVL